MTALVDTPASDGRFSDCVHLPDLGDNPDDQAVLQYALGREHAAMEQYRSLAESTEPGPDQGSVRIPGQRRDRAQGGAGEDLLRGSALRRGLNQCGVRGAKCVGNRQRISEKTGK